MANLLRAPLRRITLPSSSNPSILLRAIPQTTKQPLLVRAFTSTTPFLKKRKIAAPSNSPIHDEPPAQAKPASKPRGENDPDPENPLDFTALHTQWSPVDTHFRNLYQGFLRGGRFNPDSIGNLKVNIKDDDGEVATFPLKELCQVVPRSGRTISLLVNDKAYIKPLMSTIQSSKEFNQQPQRAPDNDLELLLKIEMERKEDIAKRVKEVTQQWKDRVRQGRTKYEKTVKGWGKDKVLTVDMVRRVEGELLKVQTKKLGEVEEEEKKLLRQLEKGS